MEEDIYVVPIPDDLKSIDNFSLGLLGIMLANCNKENRTMLSIVKGRASLLPRDLVPQEIWEEMKRVENAIEQYEEWLVVVNAELKSRELL